MSDRDEAYDESLRVVTRNSDPSVAPTNLDGAGRVLKVVSILRNSWWALALSSIAVGLVAFGISVAQTPKYDSTASLYVTSGVDANAQSAYQGSLASQQRVVSYAKLAKSTAVLENAADSNAGISVSDLAAAVSASTSAETVLLNVSAVSSDPRRSAAMANAVAVSLVEYVATLEKPSGGGAPLAKLTVVSPAQPSEKAVTPRVGRNVLIALLLGALLGFVIVFLKNRFDNRVRSVADIEESVHTFALGVVPHIPDELGGFSSMSVFEAGASRIAESYRRIRTNLTFADIDSPPELILVTSSLEGEGKTTTAINLAAALAESGKHVILVDADLRKPTVAWRLGLNGGVGLSGVLNGDLGLQDALQRSRDGKYSVLTSGPKPPNPAELLGFKRAGTVFGELKELADFVIVDCPPVLAVTDPSVVSRWVDGVILVVRSGWTRKDVLASTGRELGAASARLLGAILNDFAHDSNKSRYGYGEYYGAAPLEVVTADDRVTR